MKQSEEQFEYRDVDYLESPSGWREAKLQNRWQEGYEIWRDNKNMSWRGRKLLTNPAPSTVKAGRI